MLRLLRRAVVAVIVAAAMFYLAVATALDAAAARLEGADLNPWGGDDE